MVQTNLQKMRSWMHDALPCVAGSREFRNRRYFTASLKGPDDILYLFETLLKELRARRTVAGLFVIDEAICLPETASATDQMLQCAQMVEALGDVSAAELADGGKLNLSVWLPCPVTGRHVLFDDFDAVAFCPQSLKDEDVLYDPMMGAPVPCINFNSDIYAFSMMVRDISLKRHRREVVELDPEAREALFATCEDLWQKFALRTIRNYAALTDVAKCPVHISADETQWLANHQDPAFAETRKAPYLHDLPVLYAPRITDAWRAYFASGELSLSWRDITPYGTSA